MDTIARMFPDLSEQATSALLDLLHGKICIPSEPVISELGRLGLACRYDLRNRSRRIVLTTEGAKLLRLQEGK